MTAAADPGPVLRRAHGPVAEVVLNRPSALNALSTALMLELTATCAALAGEAGVRAVVLSAEGTRAFCAGADLKERNAFGAEQLAAQRPVFRAGFAALRELPVPVVAAVQGYALGGGLELALSCDLVVVEDSAVLGLPEVSVGLVPGGGGTQLLSRRAGLAVARDLVLTGRHVPGPEAVRLGVADRLVPTGAARGEALALAATCAAGSPTAVRAAKRAVLDGYEVPLAAGLDLEDAAWRTAAFSPDRVEGIAAFNERRPPVWADPAR
ncbi:MAG TPA: enoyl-CoA hydratase-related protein [Actinomycetes bacterium]|nr:enoyl-CoA hydratase-related protein [Actinomycetes bacterium]